jgi:hypothetical protein
MFTSQLASLLDAGAPVAEMLWPRLLPLRGQFEVFAACAATLGPVDRALGLLAAQRGQHQEAVSLLSGALDLCRRMGAEPWGVWTAADLALELTAVHDSASAERIAGPALRIAEKLAMDGQARRLRTAARGD